MHVHQYSGLSERQRTILEVIRANPGISYMEIGKRLSLHTNQVEVAISGFDARGLLLAENENGQLTLISERN